MTADLEIERICDSPSKKLQRFSLRERKTIGDVLERISEWLSRHFEMKIKARLINKETEINEGDLLNSVFVRSDLGVLRLFIPATLQQGYSENTQFMRSSFWMKGKEIVFNKFLEKGISLKFSELEASASPSELDGEIDIEIDGSRSIFGFKLDEKMKKELRLRARYERPPRDLLSLCKISAQLSFNAEIEDVKSLRRLKKGDAWCISRVDTLPALLMFKNGASLLIELEPFEGEA